MNYATINDFDEVWQIYKDNKEWFPHVRAFHIKNRLRWGQVILQDNVLITQQQYQRRGPIGRDTDVSVEKGDYLIHQIVARNKGTGEAVKVVQEYFDYINADCYLTVRDENKPANAFYKKLLMERVGYINWSAGTMKGNVWKKSKGGNT
jgi:two-component SAPR family response regulator